MTLSAGVRLSAALGAVGLSLAIANGSPVASAEPADTGSASSGTASDRSPDTASDTASATDSGAATAAAPSGAGTLPAGGTAPAAIPSPSSPSATTTSVSQGTSPKVTVSSSGGALTSGAASETAPEPETDPAQAEPPTEEPTQAPAVEPVVTVVEPEVVVPQRNDSDTASNDAAAPKSATPAPTAASAPEASESTPATETTSTTPDPIVGSASAADGTTSNTSTTPNTLPSNAVTPSITVVPVQAPADPPAIAALDFVYNVVAAVLTPFFGAEPDGPITATTPFAWAVLAFARNELEKAFAYQNSTAAPVQITQSLTGTVVGSVNVTNRYDTPMTYTVTVAPTRGTVTVDSTGMYTYTPNAALLTSGGLDQFTVTVRDSTFRLFGDSGTVTAVVPVAVTPRVTTIANPGSTGASGVVVSANGKRAFVVNLDNSISVIDIDPASATRNTVIGSVTLGGETTVTGPPENQVVVESPVRTVTSVATDSTGSTLYIAQGADSTLGVGNTLAIVKVSTTGVGATAALQTQLVGTLDLADPARDGIGVAVSADGTRAYLLTADSDGNGSVAIIDPTPVDASGAVRSVLLGTTNVGKGASALAVDNSGRVWVANSLDNTVSVIDPTTGLVSTIAVGGLPSAIAFGSGPAGGSGSYAYVANTTSNSVSVIDTNAASPTYRKVIANIVTGGSPSAIAASADGGRVYVTQSYTNSIAVIDTGSFSVTTRLATSTRGGPTGIALSADNTRALVTNLYTGGVDVVSLTPTLTPAPTSPPLVGSTHGFQVYNLSGEMVTIGGYKGNGTLETPAPGTGTVVAPGTYIDFEVVVYSGKNNTVQPYFFMPSALPNGPQVSIPVFLKNVNVTRSIAKCGDSSNQCEAIPGYKVALLDVPGTVITLDANIDSQAQQIAETLNELCFTGSAATCNFTYQSQSVIFGPTKPKANYANESDVTQEWTVTITSSESNKVIDGIKFTAKTGLAVAKAVDLSFEASLGHEWQKTVTFTQTFKTSTPANTFAVLSAGNPIYRDTGSFTLTMKNTTWNLNNVYFDSGDPNRGLSTGVKFYPIEGPPTV